jgi:hypothetical protein
LAVFCAIFKCRFSGTWFPRHWPFEYRTSSTPKSITFFFLAISTSFGIGIWSLANSQYSNSLRDGLWEDTGNSAKLICTQIKPWDKIHQTLLSFPKWKTARRDNYWSTVTI